MSESEAPQYTAARLIGEYIKREIRHTDAVTQLAALTGKSSSVVGGVLYRLNGAQITQLDALKELGYA